MDEGRVLVVGSPAETSCVDHLTEELARRRFDVRAAAPPIASSGDEVVDALTAAVDGEWVRAVVFAPIDAEALHPAPLGAEDGWHERCDGLLVLGLHVVQAAHALLADGGGQLILLLPDLSITGAAEHVPLATALEGLRALTKSAARQWGADGINTAVVLTTPELFDPDAEPNTAPRSTAEPDMEGVADVIAALLGPAGGAMTGVTLPVDGGVLMVP